MTTEAIDVNGHCYCGGVTFSVSIPAGARPFKATYCHCDSCRRAHAAPLYHVVIMDAEWFTITAGEELLQEFGRGGPTRIFCTRCGSKVMNTFGGWKPGGRTPLAFFPNLLDEATQHDLPEPLRAKGHHQPQECVLEQAELEALFAT